MRGAHDRRGLAPRSLLDSALTDMSVLAMRDLVLDPP